MAEILPGQVEWQTRLQSQRAMERAAEQEPEKEIPKMGVGVFLFALLLIVIQVAMAWLADLAGATVIGLIISAAFWVLGMLLSVILFFVTRKYRESMKEAKWLWDFSLIFDGIPVLNSIPLDLLALIYVFAKSRSKTVRKIVQKASRLASMSENISGFKQAA